MLIDPFTKDLDKISHNILVAGYLSFDCMDPSKYKTLKDVSNLVAFSNLIKE